MARTQLKGLGMGSILCAGRNKNALYDMNMFFP